MFLCLVLSILAACLAILLYHRAGESASLFILAMIGLIHAEIGLIVSPCIILYFCTRWMLL
jgi:hypothetical protein